ncbi:Threonine/homoserine efflux transporter RhtA [Sphingomonas sp. OV641]|uniref:DMT family transporter n=1 Tax=unclassified Sphingomonas TaxID=196159 RepID=UPI0008317C68|nr:MULTISPECIES: DMT family transporter [unclassified Sphingomonas]SEJ06716.1 Threonine/homoserine efflux transporter RhtA [Sphingomonas sp. OV641]
MPQDNVARAIGLRLTSVALFATMNVVIKVAEAHGAGLGEILFWRQFGAALLVGAIVGAGPGFASLRTQRFGAHVLRCVIGLTAMSLTFWTLLLLPLAEATTIGFSMPIFATVLGALVLHEATGWRRWAAVLAGFIGVLIVTQPGDGHIPPLGIATGLGAAFCTACISILLRTIGKTESGLTTVFWFSSLSLVPLSVVYATSMKAHTPLVWGLLLAVGLLGGVAQIAMTRSLQLGDVSLVVPMDYTALLWATLFGWLVFGTLPVASTWLGAPVIIASGLYIVWREHVRRRQATKGAISQE